MAVAIARALVERLVALAVAEPDREVCGLLLGTDERIAAITPAANVAPDFRRAFELDPVALFAALRVERAGGPRVIGHYHSHPGGPARPSPRDAAQAREQGALWLILANGGEVTAWRAVSRGSIEGAFDPVRLQVEG